MNEERVDSSSYYSLILTPSKKKIKYDYDNENMTFAMMMELDQKVQIENDDKDRSFHNKFMDCSDDDDDDVIQCVTKEKEDEWNIESFALDKIARYGSLCFHSVSDTLKKDKTFIINAVKLNSNVIKEISILHKNDEGVMRELALCNYEFMKYASDDLRHNETFWRTILCKQGMALKHAGSNIKHNMELVMMALENNGNAYIYLSHSLQINKDIILKAVEDKPTILDYVPDEFKIYNRKFALNCISKNIATYQFYSDIYADNEDVTGYVVEKDGGFLQYASKRLRRNKKIIMKALKSNPTCIRCALDSNLILNDMEVKWLSLGRFEIPRNMIKCYDMTFKYRK